MNKNNFHNKSIETLAQSKRSDKAELNSKSASQSAVSKH